MLSRLRKIYIAPTIKIQRREVLVKLKLSRPRADKLPVGFWPKTSWAFINWRCHVVGERSITCNSQGVAESHEIAKVIRRSKERFLHSVKRVFLYLTGADPGFFLGGGALVSFSTSTPINHKVFFFFFLQNTSCIRKPQVISDGGGVRTPCTLPLDPPLPQLITDLRYYVLRNAQRIIRFNSRGTEAPCKLTQNCWMLRLCVRLHTLLHVVLRVVGSCCALKFETWQTWCFKQSFDNLTGSLSWDIEQ